MNGSVTEMCIRKGQDFIYKVCTGLHFNNTRIRSRWSVLSDPLIIDNVPRKHIFNLVRDIKHGNLSGFKNSRSLENYMALVGWAAVRRPT